MKQRLGALARVLVSVGILAYLFNRIFQEQAAMYFAQHKLDPETLAWQERARIVWTEGPAALWAVFREVSFGWFVLGVACMGAVCLLGIWRWQYILHVQQLVIRYSRAMSIFFVGLFFNAFMLGSTGGDVVKAWYAAHETHHKKAEAVATVVVDRIIGLLALFVITLVMMTIFYHRCFDDVRLRVFALVTLAVVVATVGVTALSFWRGLADRLPGARRLLQRLPKYAMLKRLVDACRIYAQHPRVLAVTLLQSFAVHLVSMLSIVCIGYGLGLRTANGLVDYFLYLPIINTVAAVPVTISGFGVRELMYAEMFGSVGVGQHEAVALSLLGYLAVLFWSLVGGIFFLTHRQELPPATELAGETE